MLPQAASVVVGVADKRTSTTAPIRGATKARRLGRHWSARRRQRQRGGAGRLSRLLGVGSARWRGRRGGGAACAGRPALTLSCSCWLCTGLDASPLAVASLQVASVALGLALPPATPAASLALGPPATSASLALGLPLATRVPLPPSPRPDSWSRSSRVPPPRLRPQGQRNISTASSRALRAGTSSARATHRSAIANARGRT